MTSVHARAKDIFLDAVAIGAADRAAFVEQACAGDAALRREVESLLLYYDEESTNEAEPAAGAGFVPGAVIAGRYRMVARIGQGGMGDVWRADDLVLDTAIALKVFLARGIDARERLLNEVRLARKITHPSICRVFDVGEADGLVFFTMELVRGEDLAALLRHVGRLPSDKVIDIARQLCAGVGAAHSQGVLHRDLKPANVLIDDDGLARITDFGIAITTTDTRGHALTGTPAYMAPEQRQPGMAVSERTDVYSLGLVLYELIVGHDAFKRSATLDEPLRPSAIVANVDPALERVIMRALRHDPQLRWASVDEMAAALPAAKTPRTTASPAAAFEPRRRRMWLAAMTTAAFVAILAYGSTFVRTPNARTLTGQDVVLLADFENATGDPVFDGALKVALAVALEQSPFLRVFPEERARQTLRLMQRPPDERLTRAIARDIAQRERLKALLAGSIANLGQSYVVTLEAINAETGDVMAQEQAQASTKEQVLSSMGTAAARLRRKLGESLASVQKFDVPLPRATTTSLDALNAYSLALYNGREVPRLEAIPHLKRAIELDPTFAMAYALLSEVYANTGQQALAPEVARKAFELRDKVSDREQFFISWRYYRDALQAWDKALELARAWTATYPREAFPFNSLGNALIRFGQFDHAVPALREAIRLDPQFIPAYSNLAASLLALNRLPEARETLRQAAERHLEFGGARRLSFLMAFVEGDAQTMEQELAASVGVRATNAAFGWQAHALAFGGHVNDAHEQYRRGVDRSGAGNFKEVAAQLSIEDAEMHATVGQCDKAKAEIPPGLALSRDTGALDRASRALALCGASEATALSAEVQKRLPEAILVARVSAPVTAAMLALSRGEPKRAIELLEPVRSYDLAPAAELWPIYIRGQAHLQVKDGAAALKEFQTILDHRGQIPVSLLYPLAHLGAARAAALMGDAAAARASYDRVLELWKAADPALAPLNEARRERAALQVDTPS